MPALFLVEIELLLLLPILQPVTLHVYVFMHFSLRVLSINLLAIALSICISVGGYDWPILMKVRRITAASWIFSKATTILHLTAEDTILHNILHRLCIGPFNLGLIFCVS